MCGGLGSLTNMADIIPAVLETSFKEIQNKLALVYGGAPVAQLDICDGVFVDAITWPYVSRVREGKPFNYERTFQDMAEQASEMPYWEHMELELDLMVSDPKRQVRDLLNMGPKRVILHVESFKDPLNDLHDIARIIPGIVEIGLALNPDTDVRIVVDLLGERLVSFVQCMGISTLGVQGSVPEAGDFEKTLAHVRTLRAEFPELPIAVDGGVTQKSAKKLVAAGATRLIVGSAIFASDSPQKRIAEFKAVI